MGPFPAGNGQEDACEILRSALSVVDASAGGEHVSNVCMELMYAHVCSSSSYVVNPSFTYLPACLPTYLLRPDQTDGRVGRRADR